MSCKDKKQVSLRWVGENNGEVDEEKGRRESKNLYRFADAGRGE